MLWQLNSSWRQKANKYYTRFYTKDGGGVPFSNLNVLQYFQPDSNYIFPWNKKKKRDKSRGELQIAEIVKSITCLIRPRHQKGISNQKTLEIKKKKKTRKIIKSSSVHFNRPSFKYGRSIYNIFLEKKK